MKPTDILSLIKKDHQSVAALFAKIEKTSERSAKTRAKLYEKLRADLTLHAQAEERILYPRLKAIKQTQDIGYEAEQEHGLMKFLFRQIDGLHAGDPRWSAAITVLKEVVEHHVEEEESAMFKKLRGLFGKAELREMGTEFELAGKDAILSPLETIRRVVGA